MTIYMVNMAVHMAADDDVFGGDFFCVVILLLS